MRTTIELIIGASCIAEGHPLLTEDRDFAPMAEHFSLTLVWSQNQHATRRRGAAGENVEE